MMIISRWDICVSDIQALGFLGGLLTDSNWVFAKSGGGERTGFNDAGIDTFKNKKVRSVAREVIQNSLDAAAQDGVPVEVRVEAFKLKKEQAPGLFALKDHMQACISEADTPDQQKFFQSAVKKLEFSEVAGVLFHDSNTTGLTGDIESKGPWRALTRSSGVTQKPAGAGGTFGHGARAPFALSGLRTVFYITQIQKEGRTERRAVGRSVLMSHTFDGVERQAVGFFGSGEQAAPLIDSQIPEWLDALRPRTLGNGTTVAVVDARHDKFWTTFEYEVIRSYALAIHSGKLSVHLEDQELDSSNLKQRWDKCLEQLDSSSPSQEGSVDEFDKKAVESVLNPDLTIYVSTSLGNCELRVRSGDDIGSRQVSVARGRGMLITSQAKGLKQFNGFNFFDCVVWVSDNQGSATLSKLENPTHDEFSRDWLFEEQSEEGGNAWDKFEAFAESIRNELTKLFRIQTTETLDVDALTQMGAGWDQVQNDQIGIGRTARLLDERSQRKTGSQQGNGIAGPSNPPKKPGNTRKPRGFKLIPDLHGKHVSTNGWKSVQDNVKCSTKILNDQLLLRADFPQALNEKTGLLFCAVNADGEIMSLTSEILITEVGDDFLEKKINLPADDYSVEAILFRQAKKGGANGDA